MITTIGGTLPATASTEPNRSAPQTAENGKLVFQGYGTRPCYLPDGCWSSIQPTFDIWSVDPDGTNLTNLTMAPGVDSNPQWSPDGSKIVFNSNRNGSNDIFVMDADGSDLQQLTDDPADESFPTWGPSGRKIAYVSNSRRDNDIVVMTADGRTVRRMSMFADVSLIWSLKWSPDGRHFAFTRKKKNRSLSGLDDDTDVFLVRRDGTGLRQVTSRYDDLWSSAPNWSPDGRHLVIEGQFGEGCLGSECKEEWSIFTIRRDGRRLRRIASTGTWTEAPEWSPDGTTIAYTTDQGDESEYGDIWFVGADGQNEQQAIIKPDTYDVSVDWQPVLSQ